MKYTKQAPARTVASASRIGAARVLATLSLAWTAHALAANPLQVEAPEIKVGDSWIYDSIDGYKLVKEFSIASSATEVTPEQIVFEWSRTDNEVKGRMLTNRNLNWTLRESPLGRNQAEPYYPNLAFPLQVGKTWEQAVVFKSKYDAERTIEVTLKGKVLGWEEVTVPAGIFKALKIEVSGAYVGNSGSISWKGTMEDRIWYAPEVKRPVKTQYQDSASGHGYVRDYQELQSYHVN